MPFMSSENVFTQLQKLIFSTLMWYNQSVMLHQMFIKTSCTVPGYPINEVISQNNYEKHLVHNNAGVPIYFVREFSKLEIMCLTNFPKNSPIIFLFIFR